MKFALFFIIFLTSISHARQLTDNQFIQSIDYFNKNRIKPMSVIMKGDAGNPNPLAIPIAFCEVLFSLEDEEEFLKKYPQKHHLLRGSYFLEIENGKKNANFMINEYGKHGFKCSEYLPVH